jgi:phosphate-selective porin OprO/OprP
MQNRRQSPVEAKVICFLVFGLLVSLPRTSGEPAASHTIVVKNVTLVDADRDSADVVANIVIKGGTLDRVTKDAVPLNEGTDALDAARGVLLGQLKVGEPPTFIILKGDPRSDFEVLLDTQTYAVFVMERGKIRRNHLVPVSDPEPERSEQSVRKGWFAYTPPPLALPVSYDADKKWNQWDTRHWSGVFAAAIVMDRQFWLSQDAVSESQVGDLKTYEGGEIRGFRFGSVGAFKLSRPWLYTFFAATNAFSKGFESDRNTDEISLFDYRLDIPVFDDSTVSIGKQKEPISMERLTAGAFLPFSERTSVSDALMPSRNVGVVISGTALDQRMTWAGGVFNDWFDAGQSFSESATQIAGRVTGLPFVSADESALLHLGAGFRRSDAKEGVRYRTEPEFNNSPIFVDTGLFDGDSLLTWNLEASVRRGPYMINAEYVRSEVSRFEFGNVSFDGFHVTGSWVISGEMHGYNKRSGTFGRFPVSKSVSVGGWGGWEAVARYSHLDLTDGAIEGGELQIGSLGFNWWLRADLTVSMYYRHTILDRFDERGSSDGLVTRLVLMLE